MDEVVQKILEDIGKLNLFQLRDLTKGFEEKFGVKAAAPMAVAAMPVSGAVAGTDVLMFSLCS